MYRVVPTWAIAHRENGGILRPLVTLADDSGGGMSHICVDDRCFVLYNLTHPAPGVNVYLMTHHWYPEAVQALVELVLRQAHSGYLNEERATHAIQLAAISTCLADNSDSRLLGRIDSDNRYWTAAYRDACAAVDREVRERRRAENAERNLDALDREHALQPT